MNKQQIIERRKEIERELTDMLKQAKSDFSLDDIKDVIFHEKDNDDLMKAVIMFDNGKNTLKLNNILELLSDAWNYFPHEIIGGISPNEKLLEHQKK